MAVQWTHTPFKESYYMSKIFIISEVNCEFKQVRGPNPEIAILKKVFQIKFVDDRKFRLFMSEFNLVTFE